MATPAVATPLGQALSSSQDATNSQTNEGTIIQAPSGGSQTNINQNNSYNSTYGFGVGISCPTASIGVTTFIGGSNAYAGGFSSDANTFGGGVGFVMPLGGSIGESCKKLAAEIARQRTLDTQVTLIKTCVELRKLGIAIDTTKLPEFEICDDIAYLDNTD